MRKAGMTLIEIVLTISIIVLLGMLVVPRLMNATPRLAVESEGLRARADFQYAQQLAIAHNAPCQIVFDKVGGRVLIKERVEGSFVTVSDRSLAHGVTILSTTLAMNTVVFDELGEPDSGGVVNLRGTNNWPVVVTLQIGTGSVTVTSAGNAL